MKFSKTAVWGFDHALRGMRNPKDSHHLSDSGYLPEKRLSVENGVEWVPFRIGEKDMDLAQRLIKSGGEHRKFLRMIHVSVDVDMPRYWHSEGDTYHFNTKNSESTMHKLLNNNNPITLDDFVICDEDTEWWINAVNKLESMRKEYKKIQKTTKDSGAMTRLLVRAKRMLPEGFLQLRTLDTNYEEVRNMYFQRRNHRLKEEWIDIFCRWVESLPFAKELILYEG